ncbi:MAG: hypothetical protein U5Q03_17595 [Bacteroidota bacterium]|nr:hypothetical protein [Bacteroidota bacterium]
MRSVILATVLILISSFAYPGITSDSLYAEVDGNNVTLYDVGAERNCCAVYAMILTGEDHHIKWLQQSEGDICYCLCYFDLSVTTGPLEAGNYLVACIL